MQYNGPSRPLLNLANSCVRVQALSLSLTVHIVVAPLYVGALGQCVTNTAYQIRFDSIEQKPINKTTYVYFTVASTISRYGRLAPAPRAMLRRAPIYSLINCWNSKSLSDDCELSHSRHVRSQIRRSAVSSGHTETSRHERQSKTQPFFCEFVFCESQKQKQQN